MIQRSVAGRRVPAIGLGCMNLSHAYGEPPPPAQGERLLHAALDAGVVLFDTASLYGFGANEALVGRVLRAQRSRILLCSKGGMTGQPVGPGGALQRVIDGRPEAIRRDVAASLQRLGVDHIDLYYLHRWDQRVPVEDSVGALADAVRAGHIGAIGLSEVSAATLRRAHAVHPIAAVQSEYSLWTRNPELGVLQACAELGAAFVAFSPLARGYLGTLARVDELAAKDIRRGMPRFSPEAWVHNLALRVPLQALADEAGITLAQLALAWVLSRGEHVVAIPGTTSVQHLRDDVAAASMQLPPELLVRAGELLQPGRVVGARYSAATRAEVDTEGD